MINSKISIDGRLVRILADYQCSATLVSDIVDIMDKRPEREKLILYHRLSGLSQRQVAEAVGCSQSIVSTTIRGWQEIREAINWRGDI